MKRLFLTSSIIIAFLCNMSIGFTDWQKTYPLGSSSPSDLDDLIPDNLECLDRLLTDYRKDMTVIPATSSTLTANAGEIVISNAAGTIRKFRKNTTSTSIGWADIDTGAEQSSTTYYIYAIADNASVTTCTFKISASATAPSGATYYRKIGYFFNNSVSDIVNVGNIKGGDVSNIMQVTGTTNISTTSTTYTDMTDMEIKFVSSGRPVKILFEAPMYWASSLAGWIFPSATIDIDGTDYGKTMISEYTAAYLVIPFILPWVEVLSAGTHTIKIQWKTDAETAGQFGATHGPRILIVEEL